MDNYLLLQFLCFTDFCKYLCNTIVLISQTEILRGDKGFIPECNLTVSPDCTLSSSIPRPHSTAVTEGGVKNRCPDKLHTVFTCLCRYFQNCIGFDFGMFLCQPCLQTLPTRTYLMENFPALVI